MRLRVVAAFLLVAVPLAAAGAEPPHHAIEATLDPATGALSVRDTISLSGHALVTLDIAPWQRVESLAIDGRPVAPIPPYEIVLPDSARHRVSITLRGTVPAARGSGASAGPDGVYLPGQSGWLPDTGDALVTHRLSISVPAPYRAVATGNPISGTGGRAVFAGDRPAELPSLFAGPYRLREREAAGVLLGTYLHAEIAHLAEAYLDAAGQYLGRFAASIGPYPYAAFSVVSAPLPVGLGFPTLTYVGREVLPLPFMRGRSLAHEVLHSWWGNGVAVDYRTGNWAEGLTTYMADYALAADRGAAAAREMRTGWLRAYAALPRARDIPLRAFRAKRHDASQVVGYNKAAFVFHMLKGEIGAAAFEAGIRRFWRERRFTVAGWDALRAAFEREAQRDLSGFFAQWLDRPGAPELSLGPVTAQRAGDGYRLTLTIHQRRPHYRLTLPVLIGTATGDVHRRFAIDGAATEAAFMLDARPDSVALDPGFDIFRRLTPGETPPILRDVTLADNAVLLIAATGPAVAAARALAVRLLDSGGTVREAVPSSLPAAPLLIVGTDEEIAPLLETLGLRLPPEMAAFSGSARAWTARRGDALPVLVVAARDAASLRALLRPLPHYGRQSYVLFEGRRAVRRGVWPLGPSPLKRVLAPRPER